MKAPLKFAIVAALAATVTIALVLKQNNRKAPAETNSLAVAISTLPETINNEATPVSNAKLPKLVDLGAGKCIPCKMMAPILAGLKNEYAGKMNVEFIDVWVNPDAAKPYGIEIIPTQIFYDANGKELFRHVGFFSKEEILNKWKELGINLADKSPDTK